MGQVFDRKGKMNDMGFLRVEESKTSKRENKEAKDRTLGPIINVCR